MAEELGYSALYVIDHLRAQFGPLVALTVAAEGTRTLRVGTLVLNNDLRNPVVLAREIATLGLAAEKRVELGLGAGWLQSDYEEAGIGYDGPAVRVERLAESLAVMKALWRDGEVTLEGAHYKVRGARCDPRPESPPHVIVGGGSKRVLTLAAKEADTVGVNTSLASGKREGHVAGKVTVEHYDRCLRWVREATGGRVEAPELQIAPFAVMVVASHRAGVRAAAMLGYDEDEARELPAVLVGTVDELSERLLARRERWGFSNIVVPGAAMESFAPVVARLSGT